MGINNITLSPRKLKKVFHKVLLLLILTPILIVINFLFMTFILYGIGSSKIYSLNIKKPLVLHYNLNPKEDRDRYLKKFMKKFKINLAKNISLPSEHPFLVDINWIMNANPYPPLLGEFSPNHHAPYYISFGYISQSGEYAQLTNYWGEADTTPSILINKVRGKKTYYGDYYINYAIYTSKRIIKKPLIYDIDTGKVTEWNLPPKVPKINHIAWSSNSSEIIAECIFILFATPIELIFISWLLFARKRKP